MYKFQVRSRQSYREVFNKLVQQCPMKEDAESYHVVLPQRQLLHAAHTALRPRAINPM